MRSRRRAVMLMQVALAALQTATATAQAPLTPADPASNPRHGVGLALGGVLLGGQRCPLRGDVEKCTALPLAWAARAHGVRHLSPRWGLGVTLGLALSPASNESPDDGGGRVSWQLIDVVARVQLGFGGEGGRGRLAFEAGLAILRDSRTNTGDGVWVLDASTLQYAPAAALTWGLVLVRAGSFSLDLELGVRLAVFDGDPPILGRSSRSGAAPSRASDYGLAPGAWTGLGLHLDR